MKSPQHTASKSRRGIAAVEFAVCLPVLVLVVFGSIEACTMVFLKESLTVAAYEGSRTALEPTATEADVTARCLEVLTDRNVQGGTVQVLPADIAAVAAGDQSAARAALTAAQPEIMRGVTKGTMHKNTASRKISRLSAAVKRMA